MKRRQRGYVLVLVLVLLMVVTLLATRLIQTSYYASSTMSATQLQTEAVMNSNLGVNEGVARLRLGEIAQASLPLCQSENPCVGARTFTDSATASTRRYDIKIFQRGRWTGGATKTFNGSPPAVRYVVVSSTGYAYSENGDANPNFSSVTEVEVQLPGGTGVPGGGGSTGNTFGGN